MPSRFAAPPLPLDVGLLLTLALAVAMVAEPAAFPLAVALHMWLRIYDGRFAGWRKASWLLLVLFSFALVAAGFLAYVLPWGQMSFWLASRLGEDWWRMTQSAPALWGAFGLLSWVILVTDVIALHSGRAHHRKVMLGGGLLLGTLVFGAMVRDIAHIVGDTPAPTTQAVPAPQHILPSIGQLSSFAILRAVPNKAGGVALLALVLLLPAAAAFTCGRRFHVAETRFEWFWLSAGLGVSWLGLTFVGSLTPSAITQWTTFLLVAYEIAFFVVVPFVLGRRVPVDDTQAAVFD